MNSPTLPMPTAPMATPRRSAWPSRLLLLMALALAATIALALMVNDLVTPLPITLHIGGEPVWSGQDFNQLPPAHKVVLAGFTLLALLAVVVLLPVALIVMFLSVGLLLLFALGLPLLLVGGIALLLLSPLLLLGWLVWKLFAR
jgi:hypothetical protein